LFLFSAAKLSSVSSSAKKRPPSDPPLLLVNISQVLTLRSRSGTSGPRRGSDLQEIGIIKNGAVLCVAGKIVSVCGTQDALRDPWIKKNRKKIVEIDCTGQVVLPGFVDSHTHPAFTAPRLVDFEKRIAGATYEQIAEAGGGIRSSVVGVRQSSKKQLAGKIFIALQEMAEQGTTTVEAKSGYGLTLDSEIKSLEAIRSAALRWPGTVAATLLGAHVVPIEFQDRRQEYVELVCREMIPLVAKRKLARFVDVFTDRGAFTVEETEQVFEAAKRHGLGVRAHMCQLTQTALQPLLRFNVASFDHVDHIADEDIRQLARRETVATLVPAANHFLGVGKFPPARKLLEAGVAVALATDYNPGSSPTASMPFVMSLACTHMKMSPAEAIAAATVNGAWALRLHERKGTIESGKDADLAVFDVEDYREIAYWLASNLCAFSVLNGVVAAEKTN
jgi:imidazolonepropionase